MTRPLALALLWLCAGPAVAATAKPGAAQSIARTSARLQGLGRIFDTNVPAAARPLLTDLKLDLRRLILDHIQSARGSRLDPDEIRSSVIEDLETNRVHVGGEGCTDHGCIAAITLERPDGHPDLLVATTTLGINCGEDSSLYIFNDSGRRWNLILSLEANNYAKVSGAQGLFGYAVSPPDGRGGFFVAAVDINPWCSSMWQRIRTRVLRPGPEADAPRTLLTREETIYLGMESAYDLDARRDGFSLTFTAAQGLDVGLLTRRHVVRYAIDGDRAWRVAPVALRPHDFLDEWLELPWEEAARWSEPSARPDLERWHARLKEAREPYYTELQFVQPCEPGIETWQVGLHLEPLEGKRPSRVLPPELFFTISRKDAAFVMESVASVRLPGCPGETPPEQ